MKVTVLFDEEALNPSLKTGFGLSLLINDTVIFDTGSDGKTLLHNIHTLNINTDIIDIIVLSHEHKDHTGGLDSLLSVLNKPTVYLCKGFGQTYDCYNPKTQQFVTTTSMPAKITDDIFTTGEIYGTYKIIPIPEQSLFISCPDNTVTLICGCAHYGIAEGFELLVKKIRDYLGRPISVNCLIGGFHLRHESDTYLRYVLEKLLYFGVKKIAPLHCSGRNAKKCFRSTFSGGFHDLKVGDSIEL